MTKRTRRLEPFRSSSSITVSFLLSIVLIKKGLRTWFKDFSWLIFLWMLGTHHESDGVDPSFEGQDTRAAPHRHRSTARAQQSRTVAAAATRGRRIGHSIYSRCFFIVIYRVNCENFDAVTRLEGSA